jgi:sugar O-acyltransferase (sialic acid O-acetyltransferase NeuD family)
MLVIGAKGFAKEVLEVLIQNNYKEEIFFYDDINKDTNDLLFNKFKVLKSEEEANEILKINPNFTIGLGGPKLREKMYHKFTEIQGEYISTISNKSIIGTFDITIGKGCNILPNSIMSNSVEIGIGCIVYYNVILTHDCKVGNFVQLSPGAKILGRVQIGDYCNIGANATILPDIKLGDNVIVGAGALVTKDVESNTTVKGIPAKKI